MKQNVWFLSLFGILLASCAPSSSLVSSSSSHLSSLNDASTESESSLSGESITSSDATSEAISNSSTSSESSSEPSSMDAPVTLTTKWATLLNLTATQYRDELLTRTSLMVETNVTEAVAIYEQQTNTFYGFAYEANVSGNGGLIRFQIAIVNNTFAAFLDVRHNEHGAFGVRIINVFKTQLVGQPATFEAAVNLLLASNLSRSGLSETYDGMLPAIEAMVLHAMEATE